MQYSVIDSLQQVDADDWNHLAGTANPFTRHEFLLALEQHDCVGETFGWLPRHLLLHEDEKLVGAVPMYLKDNSYGEFVFDWDWAEAYHRAGQRYYPKLVVSIPYTPATGPRILVEPGPEAGRQRDRLIAFALEKAREWQVSGLHWLFTDADTTAALQSHDMHRRTGCQYHWSNAGYSDFDAFLAALSSKKRKQIKRERRQALQSGLRIERLNGHQASSDDWRDYTALYRSTFDRKSGYATLNQGFFEQVAATMPDQVLLILARDGNETVAGAINFIGTDTLYGRHWGALRKVPSLHFELCYYQAMEYCIEQGLARFEAGAQGEHKVARGFMPVATWSAHWLAHPEFGRAVADFTAREHRHVCGYMELLEQEHSPYRKA